MIDRLRGLWSLARLSLVTRSPLRFLLNQARRRGGAACYLLRREGIALYLRHGTPDVAALEQVFRQDHYAPPPASLRALHARDPLRVVDLGANIGGFGAWVLGEYPDARIVALEPEPGNADMHKQAVEAYEGPGVWELIEACAGTRDGVVPFVTGMFTNSRLAGSGEDATSLPSRDVFPWLETADFVKIDIEGAEWDILGDRRFHSLRAACIALEYHAERSPGPDPHAVAVDALERAGYAWSDTQFDAPEGHGMIWAWKDP